MWWIIVIAILAGIIFVISRNGDSSSSKPPAQNNYSRQNYSRPTPNPTTTRQQNQTRRPTTTQKPQNITQCIDRTNDRIYSLDSESSQVCKQVSTARTTSSASIRQVAQKKSISIDLSWMANLQSTLEAANTLVQNMAAQETTTLTQSKFHYYTSLHFRSMLAADFVHAEFSKADRTLKQISNLLVEIGKKNITVSQKEKTELYQVKDVVKEARRILLDKVHQLNNNTRTFKMKIYSECGERGREWYQKISTHN